MPRRSDLCGNLSPEGFCTALRKIIESTTDIAELYAWRERNAPAIARLRALAPDLRTQRGEHYADVLDRLFRARRATSAPGESESAKDELTAPAEKTSPSIQGAPVRDAQRLIDRVSAQNAVTDRVASHFEKR